MGLVSGLVSVDFQPTEVKFMPGLNGLKHESTEQAAPIVRGYVVVVVAVFEQTAFGGLVFEHLKHFTLKVVNGRAG